MISHIKKQFILLLKYGLDAKHILYSLYIVFQKQYKILHNYRIPFTFTPLNILNGNFYIVSKK